MVIMKGMLEAPRTTTSSPSFSPPTPPTPRQLHRGERQAAKRRGATKDSRRPERRRLEQGNAAWWRASPSESLRGWGGLGGGFRPGERSQETYQDPPQEIYHLLNGRAFVTIEVFSF